MTDLVMALSFGQRSAAQQNGKPPGIEGICLVALRHAAFGLERIGQVRMMTGFFHRIHNPIPMTGSLKRDLDGDGNRVVKTVNGVTTQYLVDDLNPTGYPQVVEEISGGAVTRTYTYGLQRISQAQSISGTWAPSFYGYDGLGTVRQLTNSAGTITDTYDFDSFGNKINSTGTTPNNYLYRGEQYDSDLGLYYLRARYYNPATGRFMSRDPEDGNPYDPKSLHKYLYSGGDPVNAVDPTGRDTIETIFTTTEISSPLEIGAELVGRTAVEILCDAARILQWALQGAPPGVTFWGVSKGPLAPITYLCNRFAF